jgi:predicted O-methyltransferase YrrM
MTRALPPDGRLLTLEADPRHADVTRRNARRAGLADRIEVREGPALDSLVSLRGEEFDFIFIDADKTSYPQYLEAALQLSHPGTVIVGDNVWRGGVVTEDSGDEVVQAVARYNTDLARNPRLLSTIVSTRDGGDAASISVVRAEQSA